MRDQNNGKSSGPSRGSSQGGNTKPRFRRPPTTPPAKVDLPPNSSLLARAVYASVTSQENVRLVDLQPQGAVLSVGKKTTFLWLPWNEQRAQDLAAHLEAIMERHSGGPLILGLVGGSSHARELLEKARPEKTKTKIGQIHIADDGTLWNRDAGAVRKILDQLRSLPTPSQEDWRGMIEESAKGRAEALESHAEAVGFSKSIQARRPIVTWSLAAIILAVFGLEFLLGGTQSAPVLLRMGALSPEHVRDGEVWRLLSCTFLHSGLLHVGFNTYVLVLLGAFLERVLGSWRFLLLYGLSCLAGSLVSFAFLDGFSVGASGGLWGLLGAQAVLAYRPVGLLPRAMIPGAQRAAMINLGLNLFASFRPNVDMWAHFGGGAMGGALILAGLVTRGLPRLGDPQENDPVSPVASPTVPAGPGLKLAGAATAATLLICLAIALVSGQAWNLRNPIELTRTVLPELGFSLSLPEGIELTPIPSDQIKGVTAGDLRIDPGAAILLSFPGDLSDPASLANERKALQKNLVPGPTGSEIVAGPEDTTLAGVPAVTISYRFENGAEEEVAFAFHPQALIKVDTVRWPALAQAVPKGYAARLLDSLVWVPGDTGVNR
ncbi:MAG: rhomboid family intramembrane serine protease [Deltaproteobacteria bacterium]|nr:rhomboid family intramembrane serine protease [Deltaproteobacteria bacterium]